MLTRNLCFALSAMVAAATILLGVEKTNPKIDSEVYQWLTAATDRSVFFKWDSYPVPILLSSDTEEHLVDLARQIVDEINQLAGRPVGLITIANDVHAAKISLIFSEDENSDFEVSYASQFAQLFGVDEEKYWRERGAFSFPWQVEHPCFGFGVYEKTSFFTPGFTDNNRPEHFFVTIGDTNYMPDQYIRACLREELAHAIFFIPDREVVREDESIFNSNPVENELLNFSSNDVLLFRFVANSETQNGMSFEDLSTAISEWLRTAQSVSASVTNSSGGLSE